jgi:hypothetical protein
MQIEEIAKCLLVYRGVFDASMFLELLEKECAQDWGYLSWFQTTVGSDNGYSVRPDYRSSLGCELAPLYVEPENITNNRVVPLVGEWHKIAAGLEDVIWHYRNSYGIGLSSNEGYRVLKYGAGAEYRGHIDHAPDNGRVLSMVGFLNGGFDGGELTFPLMGVAIKPEAGSVVMFPSNFPYYHYAAAVGVNDTSIKYSLVTWFR